MSIAINSAGIAGTRPAAGPTAKSPADFAAILEAFKHAAAQTPAERAREAVLKKHDMTEEDYNALPSAKRDAIDREIADMVRKVTEQKTGVPLVDRPFDAARFLG